MPIMPANPALAVVVVNWNQPDRTIECIGALRQSVEVNLDPRSIIVVDNGSTDDSAARLAAAFPDVTLLCAGVNLGFSKGTNLGIRQALAQDVFAILSLNNDANIAPDALAHLARRLQSDPRLGALNAKTYITQEPGRLWAVGARVRQGNVLNIGAGAMDAGQFDDVELDAVYGCAMFLRAEMLRKIGLFDERFFMYYEDIDLCLRARAAGYTVALEPAAHVWHDVSVSTRRMPAYRIRQEAKSRMQFHAKHLQAAAKLKFVSAETIYALSLGLRHLFANNPHGALAEWRGRLDGLPDFIVRHPSIDE